MHALTDGLGRCVNFVLTPGNVHDSTQVEVLLNGHTCGNVLADKGYDSDAIRNYGVVHFRVTLLGKGTLENDIGLRRTQSRFWSAKACFRFFQ
ncbi:hypothetical protein SCG7086_BG_00150 [Chlamydiales bacterium SCGC AG-110-P3]|nr:hypothetical protein SCG7086_BG_00150 [Chlamydiales bacterium SCGC AG-110-P3]